MDFAGQTEGKFLRFCGCFFRLHNLGSVSKSRQILETCTDYRVPTSVLAKRRLIPEIQIIGKTLVYMLTYVLLSQGPCYDFRTAVKLKVSKSRKQFTYGLLTILSIVSFVFWENRGDHNFLSRFTDL